MVAHSGGQHAHVRSSSSQQPTAHSLLLPSTPSGGSACSMAWGCCFVSLKGLMSHACTCAINPGPQRPEAQRPCVFRPLRRLGTLVQGSWSSCLAHAHHPQTHLHHSAPSCPQSLLPLQAPECSNLHSNDNDHGMLVGLHPRTLRSSPSPSPMPPCKHTLTLCDQV